MTEKEFWNFKDMVLKNCPRGEEYFCDGTPNLSVENVERKNLGPCMFRKNGRCVCLEKVGEYDTKGMVRERV